MDKYHKSCSYLIWPSYALLQLYDMRCQKTYISAISVHKYHKSFSCLFDRFTTYYNCMTWNVIKRMSPRLQCRSITNRNFSLFDRFTTSYNCMTWNVRKLISPPFQCTSITNRVLSLFDRFTTFYNCMTWNVRELISPPFEFTSIINHVFSLFDRFTTY